MILYSEAIDLLRNSVTETLSIIELPIAECIDSISANNVICDCYVSPFDNSAMDGFAVRHVDMQQGMTQLNVIGSSFAGDALSHGSSGAWEIMTGAPVPDGFDSVVKIEDVTILARDDAGRPLKIELNVEPKHVELGNNIRQAGQDFKPNDVIVEQGAAINIAHIGALSTVGIAKIMVYRQPKIALMSTGKEIVDNALQPLESGQIRNSNGPSLMASMAQMNVNATYIGTIKDEIEDYENCLKAHMNGADIIISTGAVSMGRHDFIPDSLRKLGAEIIFHKCKIRPGKPILFAKFAATAQNPNGTYYFGLPGNPISAAIGLRFFISALLKLLQGLELEQPVRAQMAGDVDKKHDFKMFYKAFSTLEAGQLSVEILQGQESFKIKPLLSSNCWAILDEDQHKVAAGELINVFPLNPDKWTF